MTTEIAAPSSPSRPNVGLLMQTLRHLEDHSENWDQNNWDTCFAGHAIRQAGLETEYAQRVELLPGHSFEFTASGVRMPDGRTLSIGEAAMELLGITRKQAGELFQSDIHLLPKPARNENGALTFELSPQKVDKRKMVRDVIANILNESGMDQEFFDFINDGSNVPYNVETGEVANVAV